MGYLSTSGIKLSKEKKKKDKHDWFHVHLESTGTECMYGVQSEVWPLPGAM